MAATDEQTLADLVIGLVAERPRSGFEICQELEGRHGVSLRGREGAIYAALVELEREGLVTGGFEETPAGRRRLYRVPVFGSDDGRGEES